MHHRMDIALRRLVQDLPQHFSESAIHDNCRNHGRAWRVRLLTPFTTLHWFLLQVLHGNTPLKHVSAWSKGTFSDVAYRNARTKLPLAVFRSVLSDVTAALVPRTESEGLWRGHRTWLVDGSSFSMSDTEEFRNMFGQPGGQRPGCGFPVAKFVALFHAGTGLLLDLFAAPLRSHEQAIVHNLHHVLKRNDVLVGDRGFCSFVHLARLAQRGVHAVFRVHQRQIMDFTPGRPHAGPDDKKGTKGRPRSRWARSLGPLDQVVEWSRPARRPDWMSQSDFDALPASVLVRELRYTVGRPGFRTREATLVTTLLDAETYPLEALAELYATRWRVEQNLRDLKITMKMDVLKCKTTDGILKELMVYAMVDNLVRVVMGEAARRQEVAIERVSFLGALRWLLEAGPDEELWDLSLNPERPGRDGPRTRKRRPKQFPVMKKPRSEWRKQLLEHEVVS